MTTWNEDMDAAPRDGTEILIYGYWAWDGMEDSFDTEPSVRVARYQEDYRHDEDGNPIGAFWSETSNPYSDLARPLKWAHIPGGYA